MTRDDRAAGLATSNDLEGLGSRSQPLVLYDGGCGLCHGLVRFVIDRDPGAVFRFAPLQGETCARLRQRFPGIPGDVDTVTLLDEARVFVRSDAVFRILLRLGWPWSMLAAFRLLPRLVTDALYRLVARTRYRIFGKADVCSVPSPERRALFLP